MHGEAHGKRGEAQVTHMACTNQREKHDCTQRSVPWKILEDDLHDRLWVYVSLTPEAKAEARRLLRRAEAPPPDTSALEAALHRLDVKYDLGRLTDAEYRAQSRAIQSEIAVLRPASIVPEIDLDAAERMLDDIALVWRLASPAHRKRLQQALFSKVWVRGRQYVEVTPARPEYLAYFAAALNGAPPDGLGGSESKAFDPLVWYASEAA